MHLARRCLEVAQNVAHRLARLDFVCVGFSIFRCRERWLSPATEPLKGEGSRPPARDRATLSERIKEARVILEKLLTLLQSAPPERDRFVSHLYQSRREYGEHAKLQADPACRSSGVLSRPSELQQARDSRATIASGTLAADWQLRQLFSCPSVLEAVNELNLFRYIEATSFWALKWNRKAFALP